MEPRKKIIAEHVFVIHPNLNSDKSFGRFLPKDLSEILYKPAKSSRGYFCLA